MKKDISYIVLLILMMLILSIWNKGYRSMFGISSLTNPNPASPKKPKQNNAIFRLPVRRRESEFNKSEYQYSIEINIGIMTGIKT